MGPRLPRLSECRDCHEPIRFVKLDTSGKLLPVNPRPGATGSVCARLRQTVTGPELGGYVVSTSRPADPAMPFRFVPHPATCEERRPAAAAAPAPAPDPSLF